MLYIKVHIEKIQTSPTAGDVIEPKHSAVIEFEPYKIDKLENTTSGGGRRRTKMSKRHSTYRTRKNKK